MFSADFISGSNREKCDSYDHTRLIIVEAACGALCEFLIRARDKLRGLLVRGLEPRLRKSGTRKFLGGSYERFP